MTLGVVHRYPWYWGIVLGVGLFVASKLVLRRGVEGRLRALVAPRAIRVSLSVR